MTEPNFEFWVTGLPLSTYGLDHVQVRAPDGSLAPLQGLIVPMGSNVLEALQGWADANPGYALLISQ